MSLENCWYRKNFLSYLLRPVSWVYQAIMSLRRFFYRAGIFKTTSFNVPVIIVGNITVGGTGKTPVVIALAEQLRRAGWRPGIVSRGYGGQITGPAPVTSESNPKAVGDEPVLLAAKTGCPLIVGKNRAAAVAALLQKHLCDVVISDDGLQHLALARTLEIVVIDGQRGFGNGFCLPAGPLREPASRLNSVDFIIVNGPAIFSRGESPQFLSMHLIPGTVYQLIDPIQQLVPDQVQTAVHAVAAIGNPSRFFATLKNLGFTVIPHSFPDHHCFQPADLNFGDDLPIIMTEKDAVKCRAFATTHHWCLPVRAELPEVLLKELFSKLPLLGASPSVESK